MGWIHTNHKPFHNWFTSQGEIVAGIFSALFFIILFKTYLFLFTKLGGGATPFLTHMIMNAIGENLVDDFLVTLRGTYKYCIYFLSSLNTNLQFVRKRANVLYSSLQQYIPTIQGDSPQGGYFLWLKLPTHSQTASHLLALNSQTVCFQPGSKFSVNSPPNFDHHVRLCFCFYEEEELVEGAKRLGQLVDANKVHL